MKIAIAQTKSVKGNISANIKNHHQFIEKAIAFNADIIVFPELSITNYEPSLAHDLAIEISDDRFTLFQELSDKNKITVAIGVPLKHRKGITISMLIFQPRKERITYSKQILHEDELPYFVPGTEQVYSNIKNEKIAFAICYESMQSTHFLHAYNTNITMYVASVAKTDEGVQKGDTHYQNITAKYPTTIVMANAIGTCDNFVSAGQSAVFKNGKQIAQLNKTQEGFLLFDTELTIAKAYYFTED